MYLEYNLSLSVNTLQTNLVYFKTIALPTLTYFRYYDHFSPMLAFCIQVQLLLSLQTMLVYNLDLYALCMVTIHHTMSCKNQLTTRHRKVRHLAYTPLDTSHPIYE